MTTPKEEAHRTIVGDSLLILPTIETDSIDAVITDPPYSSGGMLRSDRQQATSAKYTTRALPDFVGDSRPQIAYQWWLTMWMVEALRVTRPGGWLMVFTDWRQSAATQTAIEAAGWILRGQVVWVKPGGRPAPNRFRNNCEYVWTATNGPIPDRPDNIADAYPPGWWQGSAPSDRVHITQKPVELMRHLMQVLPPDQHILDPFAGSGTTGEAAHLEHHRFTGCDISDVWLQHAAYRVAQQLIPFIPQPEPTEGGIT